MSAFEAWFAADNAATFAADVASADVFDDESTTMLPADSDTAVASMFACADCFVELSGFAAATAAPTTDAFELSSALNVAVADAPAFTFAFDAEPASADVSFDESAIAADREATLALSSPSLDPSALVSSELSAFEAWFAADNA
ncbi:hypothetical protein ACIPEQ_05705, partial [Curtobacterium sp. NPDC087080]|uniref:hypothetical protein n=1 Tax=Curtobacterium sp. NPDC087080 TaxID=3363965 RepID=UPI003804311C